MIRTFRACPRLVLCAALASSVSAAAAEDRLGFTHVFDDSPLGVLDPLSGETFTDAVEEFHRSGENPYRGDEAVLADGRRVYNRWCQACHMPDASGRMGPSLIDGDYKYERTGTDKGFFEVVYGGAAGAMQAFGDRIHQDDILRTMAYIDSLRQE